MEREKRKKKVTFKVNETRIYPKRFYPYYYTKFLMVNVIPVSFFSIYQARFTLSKQFGDNWNKHMRIAMGRTILERGWVFGTNFIRIDGKRSQIRKFYIPPEYSDNRGSRNQFIHTLRKNLNSKRKRSAINRFLKDYYIKTL